MLVNPYDYTPPARTVKNVKVGDVLKVKIEYEKDSDFGRHTKIEEYCVEAVYPFYVRAFNGNIKRCFSIGDLVLMGKEPDGYDKR